MNNKFWLNKITIFDPCVGKGAFIVVIYDKLINLGYDRRTILTDILYFADINPVNIMVVKLLLDPNDDYNLNYHIGDTLKLDISKWNIDGFDLVIGNPPYQTSCGNKGKGNTLWDKFVVLSLNKWVKYGGYLIFVHPQGWRQLDNKTGRLMLSKQIIYLNMNDVNTGKKVFNCSTTFDFYIMNNITVNHKTLINDYHNVEYMYNLKDVKFIPNHSLDTYNNYIDLNNTYGILNDRGNYGADKKWMSLIKTDEFKYPCIYSINKDNELSLRYSKINNKGHFDIRKFIISNGSGYHKDYNGTYGCTQWAYYILCKLEDFDDILKCFKNKQFLNLIDSVKLTSNKYNYVILKHLKKEFWRDFN